MISATFQVTCNLVAPFLTRSSDPGAFKVDTPVARDKSGVPMIPGTLLKGRLRDVFRDLGKDTSTLFGLENETPGNEPHRGSLYFDDLVCQTPGSQALHLTRIALDEDTGRVRDGAIQIIESPWPAGQHIAFHGQIRLISPSEEEMTNTARQLRKGLALIQQLGGNRGTGFGRVDSWNLTTSYKESHASTNRMAEADQPPGLDLAIYPQSPFCISLPRTSGNVYDSDTEIPGNVIKGCLAELLYASGGATKKKSVADPNDFNSNKWPTLRKHFDKIIIRHGFPTETKTRPTRFPLSLVKNTIKGTYHDACALSKAAVLNDRAPAFSVDWKYEDSAHVTQAYGWTYPKRSLRVRTRIDEASRRAKDGMLFAHHLVVPGDTVWRAAIDFSLIEAKEDLKALSRELHELFSLGLQSLGKTKASAECVLTPIAPIAPTAPGSNHPPKPKRAILVLQTPALIACPDRIRNGNMLEACQAGFDSMDTHAPTPSDLFASQSWRGGGYLQQRFQTNNAYRPWLLFDAGSTFIFESLSDDQWAVLNTWTSTGLPMPTWVEEQFGKSDKTGTRCPSWTWCPFIRENGFGEIQLNPPLPASLNQKPTQGTSA